MNEVGFLVGQVVQEVRLGQSLRLVFDPGESVAPSLYVALEQTFTLESEGERHVASLDDPASLGPVLGVVGQTVTDASIEGAVLTLHFTDGSALRCPPHPEYEAWEVVGGTPQALVVCVPPGDVAVWEERPA